MFKIIVRIAGFLAALMCVACTYQSKTDTDGIPTRWLLVDNFEAAQALHGWTNIDVQNDTDPFVPNPQISEIRVEAETGNQFMLRKPAADGVVGNRKAIGFKPIRSIRVLMSSTSRTIIPSA